MNAKINSEILLLMLLQGSAFAESPDAIVKKYELSARETDKKFGGFSSSRGQELYFRKVQTSKGEISCSTCHTANPKERGRTRANKDIAPLAPASNGKRFTDYTFVEKWFTRNCDDVFRRPCTAQEKGDFITFLLSVK